MPVRPMLTMLALTLLGTACTGESKGRPDNELGGLVIAPNVEVISVDIDKASKDADALLNALHLPHTWVGVQLGAHVVKGQTSLRVQEGDSLLKELDDTLTIDLDGEDRFNLTFDNSKDYGRHVIFDGNSLFLRPRFGKYHGRLPQTENEATSIRNEVFAGASEYLDLFRGQMEVSDRGAKTHDRRATREIAIKLAPNKSKAKPDKKPLAVALAHKAWRDTIEVLELEGSAMLDNETGVVLHFEFRGRVRYQRDGRNFVMTVSASQSIEEIAHTRAVEAPAPEMVQSIPARRRELAEREALLKSIASPARRAPLPSDM